MKEAFKLGLKGSMHLAKVDTGERDSGRQSGECVLKREKTEQSLGD